MLAVNVGSQSVLLLRLPFPLSSTLQIAPRAVSATKINLPSALSAIPFATISCLSVRVGKRWQTDHVIPHHLHTSLNDGKERCRTLTRAAPQEAHMFSVRLCPRLRRFPVDLGHLNPPPVRHVATVAAVELLGNAVVTSWAPAPIVLLRFHCFGFSFNFACVQSAVIIIKLATSATA